MVVAEQAKLKVLHRSVHASAASRYFATTVNYYLKALIARPCEPLCLQIYGRHDMRNHICILGVIHYEQS
jgi:hypothetical protein